MYLTTKKIIEWRSNKGLTIYDASNELDISPSFFDRLVRGEVLVIRNKLQKISRVLDISYLAMADMYEKDRKIFKLIKAIHDAEVVSNPEMYNLFCSLKEDFPIS